jgi:hypothetical protein
MSSKSLLFLLLPIGLLFSLASCDKEGKTGTVELQFKAFYDDQPLVLLQPYDYNDTLDIFFQRFNFFISDVLATPDKGDAEELIEIDYVDFDAVDDLTKAAEGWVIKVDKVPAGKYRNLKIGLGVPADLNATKESDYPDTHPLGKESHYWTAWESYIFTMINAKVDTDGDGVFDDSAVAYHLGSDAVYRTVEFPHTFEVEKDGTTRIVLNVNLHHVFKEGNGYMDIIAIPATHTIANLDQAIKASDNFANAFTIGE